MNKEHYVDGSFFTFPAGWEVEKVDEWPEQHKLTAEPFMASSCDLVAIHDDETWLVEVKDYTYEAAEPPRVLARTVGRKVFHTLAVMESVALWGSDADRRDFSQRALSARMAKICLAIELPHGGRGLFGIESLLMTWFGDLKKVTKTLNVHRPVISNSFQMGGVPWTIRRDPERRHLHADR